ncbi:histidinol phosphatase [Vibrio variabilis]|uniref:Histidinol phosphatase n=1 Tax=Vibrio variabilis TaxID=990271 RepID=A0ABQ0JFH6_9VIBR|nr:histidinol phosphatase [Vibrio variabilis]
MNALPIQPVLEHITQLAANEKGAVAQIERVLERVNKMYLALSKVLKIKKEKANQLIAFCSHPELREVGSFKEQVSASPKKSLQSIHSSFQGPSRDNVIKLLRKN